MQDSRWGLLGRGGARQAASLAQSLELVGDGQSVLVKRLLMVFCWGLLSANTVQWLADGAEQDGLQQEVPPASASSAAKVTLRKASSAV